MRNHNRLRLNETTNRAEYNRLVKQYRAHVGDICCGYCAYNRSENHTHISSYVRAVGGYDRYWSGGRKHCNWKWLRKTQWK